MKNPKEETFTLSIDDLDVLETFTPDDAEKIRGGGVIFVDVGGAVKIDNKKTFPTYDDLGRIAIDFTGAG